VLHDALASSQVLELEGKEQGDWGFKALKQMIKINFRLVSKNSYFHGANIKY
jgi:hypothetical protein